MRVREKRRCGGKAVIIAYLGSVSKLGDPPCKARAPYYIVTCGLSGSAIFSPILS
jgi:hypothetical protein